MKCLLNSVTKYPSKNLPCKSKNMCSSIMFTLKNYNIFSVPPEIDDLQTSSDVHVNEGDEAVLKCYANGHPKPEIKWLREDRSNFTIYDKNNKRMIGKQA